IERWWRELHHRLEKYFKLQLNMLFDEGLYDPENQKDSIPFPIYTGFCVYPYYTKRAKYFFVKQYGILIASGIRLIHNCQKASQIICTVFLKDILQGIMVMYITDN
ncbi:hypothetical protein QZH41_017311, partial [Actinostola sp. cb2023]